MQKGTIKLSEIFSKLDAGMSRLEFESIKNKKVGPGTAGDYIEALISSNILDKSEGIYFLFCEENLTINVMDIRNKKPNLVYYGPNQFSVERIENWLEEESYLSI